MSLNWLRPLMAGSMPQPGKGCSERTTRLMDGKKSASAPTVGVSSQWPCHLSGPEVILVGISDGMLISHDGGASWQRADLPMKAFKDATCVQEIAFHPRQPETILVGTRRTAYVSFDGGKSWERLARGIGFGDIAVIRFNPRHADEVLIGDAQGGGCIFRSTGGNSSTVSTSIPHCQGIGCGRQPLMYSRQGASMQAR